MNTIIEVRSRGGQLRERLRTAAPRVRIGRSFDNDLIVDDRHVSPHHLELTATEDGWQLHDLDSLNGFEIWPRRRRERGRLQSGDHVRIGHTDLHVYRADHPLPETLPVDGNEDRVAALGRHSVWPVVLVLLLVVMGLEAYFASFREFRWAASLGELIGAATLVGAVAGLWALVGKLLRHRARFLAQLSVWAIVIMLSSLTTFVSSVVAYNFNSGDVYWLMEMAFSFLLITGAVSASLLLATTLRRRWRVLAAAGVSAGLLAFLSLGDLGNLHEFAPDPDYYSDVMHPRYLWARPQSGETPSRRVTGLVERVEKEAERLAAEDEAKRARRLTAATAGEAGT